MRPRMPVLFVVFAVMASSAARAQSPDVPDQCREVASVPADAQLKTVALRAKLSLASCSAEVRFAALKLAPDDQSIQALAAAAKPSLALYDEVLAANDPTMTLITKQARADLLVGMVVRMRNSVPAITMQSTGPQLADHDRAHADLEAKLKPWLEQAE